RGGDQPEERSEPDGVWIGRRKSCPHRPLPCPRRAPQSRPIMGTYRTCLRRLRACATHDQWDQPLVCTPLATPPEAAHVLRDPGQLRYRLNDLSPGLSHPSRAPSGSKGRGGAWDDPMRRASLLLAHVAQNFELVAVTRLGGVVILLR